jgi:hypothetical protein
MADDPPSIAPQWSVALESPRKCPAVDPDVAMSAQSAESLLAQEAPEFTAPMGLTLDMDRVKVTISKHLRNRMRLADRFNRALISGPSREKALKDVSDWRCRARDTDPPAVQAIFDLAFRIEAAEHIEDEKTRYATIVQLTKQQTHLITAFEANNTRLFTELWSLVEMHQRQTEHKDKLNGAGLGDMSTAKLREVRDAAIRR